VIEWSRTEYLEMPKRGIDTVSDLSKIVRKRMISLGRACPSLQALHDLFQTLFSASLYREEAADLLFDIVILDPAEPDPNPPPQPTLDRWDSYSFSTPLQASLQNIVKLARASDRRASSFAVYYDVKTAWYIWGMVDQADRYYSYLTRASDSGSARPGLFQASIAGPGHLIVYVEYEKLAELRVDRLIAKTHDIFWRGPVHEKLLPGIESYITKVISTVGASKFHKRGHWTGSLAGYWINSLCDLLLRVQGLKHGGALLLNPGNEDHLKIKYRLQYDRLRSSLFRRAVLHIDNTDVSDMIFEEVLDTKSNEVPVDYYLDESITASDIRENDREISGALWFIACLSRVDGLIVIDKDLTVLGFGAEITVNEIPKIVVQARSRLGGTIAAPRLDYEHFGTRHRSMIRYIGQNSNSIGFVISQDASVRAVTQVGGKVVVWDDLKLHRQSRARVRRSGSKS